MEDFFVYAFGSYKNKQTFICRNINALSKHHTVYAIDLLGFGASEKPPGFSYTMESWAEVTTWQLFDLF